MFIRVTLFAAAMIAVSAQDYSHGHATSSQSVIRHDGSHNNNVYQTYASPISYHTSPSHSIPSSYLRPALQIPITHSAVTHAAPITPATSITYAAPVTLHGPLHTAAITHADPVYNHIPLHTSAITHATPLINHVPLHTSAITHAAPITHHVPLHTSGITHAAPVYHTPLIHTAPTQYYSPIRQHVAPILHHSTPVTLQYAPGHYNQLEHVSGHQDYHTYPRYGFEYRVQDTHTGDIKFQHEERDGDVVNGAYSLHEADGSVRTVNYNSHGHNGFNAEVHHSQPSTHIQTASHYAPNYYHH